MRTQKEYDKLVEENGLLKARLETAERLALQGGAGHQAIVDKAVSLKKFNDDLVDFLEAVVGFCVNFRQTEDWENHPDIGVLYALAKTILAKNKGE